MGTRSPTRPSPWWRPGFDASVDMQLTVGRTLRNTVSKDEKFARIFFNDPLVVGEDVSHSQDEPRGYALGQTSASRELFVAFTISVDRIRIISVRPMSPREQRRF